MSTTKRVYDQAFKTLSIPSLKLKAMTNDDQIEHEYSILGGFLYVDGDPVHHYFSKNMFYYEKDGVQYSIFLHHHGLMADIVMRRQDGTTTTFKAGSELHYTIAYEGSKSNTLNLTFGMGVDSARKTYYYCGLLFNNQEIISLPKDESSCKNQSIMSITYEPESGNLISTWNTEVYIGLKDEEGKLICPDFTISSIKMIFDALYNTCEASITEGKGDCATYGCECTRNFTTSKDKKLQGKCLLSYEDNGKTTKKLELFGIDSITYKEKPEGEEKEKEVTKYFCGIKYNDKEVLPVPANDTEKKAQDFLRVSTLLDWTVNIHKDGFTAAYNLIRKNNVDFYIQGVNIVGSNASIIENKSDFKTYTATGTLDVKDHLIQGRKRFQMDKDMSETLKQNCFASNMLAAPLTLESLCSTTPPTKAQEVIENGKPKIVIMDGQQYCGFCTTELLIDMINYYAGDTTIEDKSIKFSDIFGANKISSKIKVDTISPLIFSEIENAENKESKKTKGYLKDFLITMAPMILTNALAEKPDKAILNGYGGEKETETALQKVRYYLSYTPDPKKETEKNLNVLSAKSEYHEITAILDKYIYLSLVHRLKDFMEDKTTTYPGQKPNQTAQQYWAEQMFYHYMSTLVMFQQSFAINPAKVTHIIKVLGILDSNSYEIKDSINGEAIVDSGGNKFKSSYSLALYAHLLNFTTNEMVNTYKGETDFENYCKLLIELYGKFYEQIKSGKITLPKELMEELQKFLIKDKDTFTQWAIFESLSMMQVMVSAGNMMSSLITYSTSAPGICKLFSTINILLGMTSFASIMMNWDSITPAQKAQSILAVFAGLVSVARNGIMWHTINVMLDSHASSAQKIDAYQRFQAGGGRLEALDAIGYHPAEGEFNLKEHFEQSSKKYSLQMREGGQQAAAYKMSGLTRVFCVIQITFELLNIALMGIAFILAVISLVSLFKHESSYSDAILALSTLNTICAAASFVLGGSMFVLGFTSFSTAAIVTSWLPAINGVLMAVMFVISLVLLILHKDTQPPLTVLIQKQIKGKVADLTAPPEEWVKEHTSPGKTALRNDYAVCIA